MSEATTPPHDKPGEPAPTFQQRLGLFDATMLVVGTMIGSGIFATSVAIAQDVGSAGWLLVVWGLAGFMTIIGALSYAELAAMMPFAGGQYVYLREQYNPLCGFLYGWTCFLVIQTGSIAAVAVVFASYLGVLVPELGTNYILLGSPDSRFALSSGKLVAVVVIVFLTGLNCRGVQEGKIVQNIFTVAKTLALVALIVVGLTVAASGEVIRLNTQDWWGGIYTTNRYTETSSLLGTGGRLVALMVVGGAMVGSLFSADAWNNVTFTAGETRNPRRNLPLSLALGTGGVILLYMLANAAYLTSLPVRGMPGVEERVRAFDERSEELRSAGKTEEAEAVSEEKAEYLARLGPRERGIAFAQDRRLGAAVMELWSPRLGAPLMALAIMVSTFGCVNGMILMGARLYYVMANDNLFFKNVGTLNARGVPQMGLITQGLWSVLLVFSGSYDDLLDYVIFAVLIFYVLTVAGLFILRRTRPNAERPYKAVGYPVLPAVYVLLCALIMLNLLVVKPIYTWPGLLIMLTGVPVYFLWRAYGRRPSAV
jgi:APA family basic amino acid/polyamine antiporter